MNKNVYILIYLQSTPKETKAVLKSVNPGLRKRIKDQKGHTKV